MIKNVILSVVNPLGIRERGHLPLEPLPGMRALNGPRPIAETACAYISQLFLLRPWINTTGVTSGAGTVYHYGAPKFTSRF
jgi:hypothetical protein